MIDALLFACRDAIRTAGYGYDNKTCDIRAEGKPPTICGDKYAAIHQGDSTSTMQNTLNEYFSFFVTLTRRITIPLDRIAVLTSPEVVQDIARKIGLNAQARQIGIFLHMNWGMLQDANNYLVQLETPVSGTIYGFCEPAIWAASVTPQLVTGEWFGAEPDAEDMGIRVDLRFDRARRFQPTAVFS